jgi:hypothetical protein
MYGQTNYTCCVPLNSLTSKSGFCYKYDVSLAPSDFGSFIRDVQVLLEDISRASSLNQNLLCVNWGHIIGKTCLVSSKDRKLLL